MCVPNLNYRVTLQYLLANHNAVFSLDHQTSNFRQMTVWMTVGEILSTGSYCHIIILLTPPTYISIPNT